MPRAAVAGDFNGDGKLDAAVLNSGSSSDGANVSILLGNGAGGFVAPNYFPTQGGAVPFTLVTGDFNRAGKPDVLTTNSFHNSVTLFTNTCVENIAPVAADDGFAGRQATTLNVAAPGVLANDTDFENNPLTAVLVAQPSQGTVALNADGSFAYTPPSNFHGVVSFTYKASDGRLQSNAVTVTLTINNPPIANNDGASVPEDGGAFPLFVLQNDSVDQGETIIGIISVTQGAHGAVAVINNGQAVTYMPTANFSGADMFTYTIADNNGGLTATGSVFIDVFEINDPPTANDDYVEIPLNSPATTIDVLANDTTAPDVGETLQITAVTQGMRGGAVIITNNGANLTYRPPTNFTSGDSFTYTVSDGRGGTDTATVTVDVPNTLIVTNNSDIDDGVATRIAVCAKPSMPPIRMSVARLSNSPRRCAARLMNAVVVMTGANGINRSARTIDFGYFHFAEVAAGQIYVFSISSKRYSFAPQVVSINEDLTELNFTAAGENQ